VGTFSYDGHFVPSDEVVTANGLSAGYLQTSSGDKLVALSLMIESGDSHVSVAYGIQPEDVQMIVDNLLILRDKIGTNEWPDNVFNQRAQEQ